MKKVQSVLLTSFLAMATLVVAACNGDDTTAPEDQVVTVTVTPPTATVTAIQGTQQFTVVAADADGNPIAGLTFTWASSNPAVATVDANGLATAAAEGTTGISATAGGVTGNATLTVAQEAATIEVTPAEATLVGVGATQQYSAEASDANGFPLGTQPTFTWDSGDDAVATVDTDGLVTGEARGATQITATVDAVNGSADVTVQGILHWTDQNLGTSSVPGALTALGLTATEAADGADFVSLLQEGGWGLVIFGEQNLNQFTGALQTELEAYVAAGGRLLAVTWLTSPLPAFMEATQVGTNYADLVADAHPIFDGLPGNINLTNPGWGTYAQAYTANGTAECIGSTTIGDCGAILGNGDQTLLLGPLFDTYTTQSEGETLVAQSIEFLIGATSGPAALSRPSTTGAVYTPPTGPRESNARR